jgi:small subunit ribosomal protein S1
MSADQDAAEPLASAAPQSGDSSPSPPPVDSPAPAAPAAALPEAAPPQVAAPSAAPEERPSQRIQIGSQRDADAEPPRPKPLTPGTGAPPAERPEKKRKNYPPPNVRAQLSPELEKELEAALAEGSLEELLENSASSTATAELAPETRVAARVVSINDQNVFLDFGAANQGVAPLTQFEKPPEVGAEVNLVVIRFNNDEGLYELSLPAAAVDVGNWDEVREGQVVEVTVSGANKGGLECQVAGIRGFIPMGQISVFRVENPEEYVGQRLAVVVTEANRRRKNLVLSHRSLMERERKEQKEKLLAEIAPGELREGVVRSLQDFGAFVDLGGADGLIHVSQMSWDRIAHPSEVLQVGQKIKVRVEKVNAETGKISLTYREMGENPWTGAPAKYPVGARVKGTVSKLMQFGAFVKLEPGVEGLIHISELGHGRVFRTSDVLSEGQEVEAKVLSCDAEAQRISLSLKALLPPPEKPQNKRPEPPPKPEPTPEELKKMERRRAAAAQLKGGIGGPSGGEKFGLKW